MGGKEFKREGPARPGIIFYNAGNDESGGLIFEGKLDDKGRPAAGMHFSMDRFGGDQQLAIGHYEQNATMTSGLNLYDRGLVKDYDPLWKAYQGAADGPATDNLLQRWRRADAPPVRWQDAWQILRRHFGRRKRTSQDHDDGDAERPTVARLHG